MDAMQSERQGNVLTLFVTGLCSARVLPFAQSRYLSSYYTYIDVPKLARDGYENPPTLVGLADVFINRLGYVWNEKARKERGATLQRC